MNRYDEIVDDSLVPSANPHLGSNIHILREEGRMSINELAEKVEMEPNYLREIEKGKIVPKTNEIKKLLPYLRISYYDIMTRDIYEERKDADKKLRGSSERRNYNWYYGSKKVVVLSLVYLISVPCLYLFGLFVLYPLVKYIYIDTIIYKQLGDNFRYIFAYFPCAIISGIIIVIKFLITHNYHFSWWHIFILSLAITITEALGIILTIPYYIYTIVSLIIKKGRNHR